MLDSDGLKRRPARDDQANARAVRNERLKGGHGFSPFTTTAYVYTVDNDNRALAGLVGQFFKSIEYLDFCAPCFNPRTDFCNNAALEVLGQNKNGGLAATDPVLRDIAQQMCLTRAPLTAYQELRIKQNFERRAPP